MSEPPIPEVDPPIVTGWVDAAAQAETNAKVYADEQDVETLLVAGRLVPRNMDRAPSPEDGTDLLVGTGWNQYDPATADLVQMWRWDGATWQSLDMSAQMIPVLDIGSGTVGDLTGDRVTITEELAAALITSGLLRTAATGQRVEIDESGVTAYDETGAVTARIDPAGGVFVGGEFRTSDTLPGQVVISDTAHRGTPGMSIEPDDPAGYDVLPSIGPGPADMQISGGVSTDGTVSGANFNATGTSIYHNGPGENGAGAWSAVNSSGVEMRYRTNRAQLTPQSLIRAYEGNAQVVADGGEGTFSVITTAATNARVATTRPDGQSAVYTTDEFAEIEYRTGEFSRKLHVDATGVWVKTGSKSYNLEETAQDSGWQTIPLATGITGAGSPAWRNKGGVIYMRGTVDAAWVDGWNTVSTGLPVEMRPAVRVIRTSPSTGGANLLFRMNTDGLLQFYRPGSGNVQGDLSGLFYPLG